MRWLADLFVRIPRYLLFAAAAMIQVALVAALVADRARLLREGTEVTLETRPVDPRDFLRGDYVVLSYGISWVDAGELTDATTEGKGTPVYVKLAPKGDVHDTVSVHRVPVTLAAGEVQLRGRIVDGATCGVDRRTFCRRLQVSYGIERYFVPEGEGRAIEQARDKGKVAIVAAVTASGRAAIKRLVVDGRPVYEEPRY
jgi:uncharacterized membrane-anchored protein